MERRGQRRLWPVARGALLVITALGAGTMTVAMLLPWEHGTSALWASLAAFASYGWCGWLVVAALLLAYRLPGRALAPLAGALAVLHLVWLWPSVPVQRPGPGVPPTLTVMTLNTYYGWADGRDVLAAAERYQPDLVVLNEVTDTPFVEEPSWRSRFPHAVGTRGAPWSSDNTLVFSRYPLALVSSDAGRGFEVLRAALPSGPVTVIAVHATNPTVDVVAWTDQLHRLRQQALAANGRGLVVLGDFNAVPEHEPYARLLDGTGLVDAATSSGAGRVLTYPADGRKPDLKLGFAVPLLAIDHVLSTPDLACSSLESFPVIGTDHLGLVARC